MCFYDVPSYYAYSTSCGRNDRNMGKQKDLTQEEKKNIVQGLAHGKKQSKFQKNFVVITELSCDSLPTATRQAKDATKVYVEANQDDSFHD